MDLHGNAALSWSGRRQLARRVVDQSSAGSLSMSLSTTTAASPTPKYCRTRKQRPQPPSSDAPLPSTAVTASRCGRSSATTAPPTLKDPPPAHPAPPAADKREGRALYPHDAHRLGRRRDLRLRPRTRATRRRSIRVGSSTIPIRGFATAAQQPTRKRARRSGRDRLPAARPRLAAG